MYGLHPVLSTQLKRIKCHVTQTVYCCKLKTHVTAMQIVAKILNANA